ncbi:hypothetical protein C2E23DRAFT_727760 [Lenzites betulinus]|nr:hypothetical protein C2E23DRAFT_727760 [Lenzites betulinus]
MEEGTSVLHQLQDLHVPPEFAKYDDQTDAEVIVRLEQWKQRACDVLSALKDGIHARGTAISEHKAEIIYRVSAFDGNGSWVFDSSRATAQDILSSFKDPNVDLLEKVLRDHVKPIFSANPHPNINVETGRKLAHSAGGPLGHLDYLEAQQWKSHPEIYNVLSWCLQHAEDRAVGRLWHLFIPPIMTYLDDYQAEYKLQGVSLVSILLQKAPAGLFHRTGVDALLMTSLKTCLTFLHNPETPQLIRAAVSTYINLIESTTSPGSAARFEQLCSLLGDSIIGNIWVYASSELDALEASLHAIPEIVSALGIGTSRYLKALIPQLVFPLLPTLENDMPTTYKLASVRALSAVIQACEPRIYKWRGMILSAILKCWVDQADRSTEHPESLALLSELKRSCTILTVVCRATDAGFDRILLLDPALFGPLLYTSETSITM